CLWTVQRWVGTSPHRAASACSNPVPPSTIRNRGLTSPRLTRSSRTTRHASLVSPPMLQSARSVTVPVASDTARALSILGICFGAASVARARERRLELALDHRLDELAHPVAQAGFDRIKPIVEKIDRRLGCRLQDR